MKTSRRMIIIVTIILVIAMLPISALATELPFNDVAPTAWYYQDVKKAVETGLINGRTPTTYVPDGNMTYAEAVKLAACMHQKFTTGSVSLKNGSPWYQSYVDYAKGSGIIAEDFPWNENATRAGYMGIFAKALPDTALVEINTIADNAIPDVPMTHVKSAAIYKLYRAGIVQGVDDQKRCSPDSNIKRSEVAAILTRMMDKNARLRFTMGTTPTPTEQKPVITKQPVGAIYKIGESVVFSIEAIGPNLKYQWYTKSDGGVVEKMPLATTAVIKTRALNAADGKRTFWCEVSNDFGTVISNIVAVDYEAADQKPIITKQPSGATYKMGESLIFSIEAAGDNLQYQWYTQPKNGEIEKIKLGVTPAIKTRPQNAADNGRSFWCVVSNNAGSVTSDTVYIEYVLDNEAPKITKQPENELYKDGGKATFSIEATGTNLKYQWYAQPEGGQVEKMPLATTPSIVTRSLTPVDNGTAIWCEVSNESGKVVSDKAFLIYIWF